jgi:hypothetical protein
MKCKSIVQFKWSCDTNKDGKVPVGHVEDLKEHAWERIASQQAEGMWAGELYCNLGDEHYSGWWDITSTYE